MSFIVQEVADNNQARQSDEGGWCGYALEVASAPLEIDRQTSAAAAAAITTCAGDAPAKPATSLTDGHPKRLPLGEPLADGSLAVSLEGRQPEKLAKQSENAEKASDRAQDQQMQAPILLNQLATLTNTINTRDNRSSSSGVPSNQSGSGLREPVRLSGEPEWASHMAPAGGDTRVDVLGKQERQPSSRLAEDEPSSSVLFEQTCQAPFTDTLLAGSQSSAPNSFPALLLDKAIRMGIMEFSQGAAHGSSHWNMVRSLASDPQFQPAISSPDLSSKQSPASLQPYEARPVTMASIGLYAQESVWMPAISPSQQQQQQQQQSGLKLEDANSQDYKQALNVVQYLIQRRNELKSIDNELVNLTSQYLQRLGLKYPLSQPAESIERLAKRETDLEQRARNGDFTSHWPMALNKPDHQNANSNYQLPAATELIGYQLNDQFRQQHHSYQQREPAPNSLEKVEQDEAVIDLSPVSWKSNGSHVIIKIQEPNNGSVSETGLHERADKEPKGQVSKRSHTSHLNFKKLRLLAATNLDESVGNPISLQKKSPQAVQVEPVEPAIFNSSCSRLAILQPFFEQANNRDNAAPFDNLYLLSGTGRALPAEDTTSSPEPPFKRLRYSCMSMIHDHQIAVTGSNLDSSLIKQPLEHSNNIDMPSMAAIKEPHHYEIGQQITDNIQNRLLSASNDHSVNHLALAETDKHHDQVNIGVSMLLTNTLSNEHRHLVNLVANNALRQTPYRCHVCGSGFEDRHRLQQHLSIHLNLHPSWFEEKTIKETMAQYEQKRGDYLCIRCNLRFDTTAEFDRHMQLHGEKPHQCELCNQDNKIVSFRHYRQLLTHLRSHCFQYSCRFAPDCKQTANRKDYLKLHILKHHLNNKLPDLYTICCH